MVVKCFSRGIRRVLALFMVMSKVIHNVRIVCVRDNPLQYLNLGNVGENVTGRLDSNQLLLLTCAAPVTSSVNPTVHLTLVSSRMSSDRKIDIQNIFLTVR